MKLDRSMFRRLRPPFPWLALGMFAAVAAIAIPLWRAQPAVRAAHDARLDHLARISPTGSLAMTGSFTTDAIKFVWAEPAEITGTVNDWDDPALPLGGADDGSLIDAYSFVLVHSTTTAGVTLTGMVVPTPSGAAEPAVYKRLCNFENGPLTITDDDISSAFANRFRFLGVNQLVIPVGHCKEFYTLGQQWRPISESPTHTEDDGTFTDTGPLQVADSAFATATELGTSPGMVTIEPKGTNVPNPTAFDLYILEARTVDTTAAPVSITAATFSQNATRGAGGNNLSNVALLLDSRNGQTNYALQFTAGDAYTGLAYVMNFWYEANNLHDLNGNEVVEAKLKLGGGDFTTTTRQQVIDCATIATTDHGTTSTDASNCAGTVTSFGANTSFTITFGGGGYLTSSKCFFTVHGGTPFFITNSTPSATAPVFSCFAATTGAAANCPDLDYQCEGHN